MAETGDIIKSGLPVTGRAKAMQQRLTTPSGIVSSAEMPGVTPTTVSKKASKRIPPIKFDAEGDPRKTCNSQKMPYLPNQLRNRRYKIYRLLIFPILNPNLQLG